MPDQLPDVDAMFPDHGAKPAAGAASSGDLPDVDEMFPESGPRRVAPGLRAISGLAGVAVGNPSAPIGPFADWLFSDKDHSSLARVADAFGGGFMETIGEGGSNLAISPKFEKEARDLGMWNDYAKGHNSLIKSFNESLMRSGAILVNGALYGVPALIHGGQEAVVEASKQAEQTTVGHAIGARKLGQTIAAIPEAFPDFNFRMGIPPRPGALPRPLETARDLKVIGAGEDGWQGTTVLNSQQVEAAKSAAPTIEAPVAEAGTMLPEIRVEAPLPPQDLHAVARSLEPQTFAEYDSLVKRRDLFRKWIDELDASARPQEDMARVAQNLKDTEARIAELAPKVQDAYRAAEQHVPPVPPAAAQEAPAPAAAPTAIDRTHDVPYLAGSSEDGTKTYIDKRVPAELTVKGKTFDPATFLAVHEAREHELMKAGEPYESAHREALKAERSAVEAAGIDWDGYQEEMHKLAGVTEHETAKVPPPDLYTKPYPHREAEFLKREGEGAPAAEAAPGPSIEAQRASIAKDIADSLVKAGRPREEANLAGELYASRYAALSQRFNGRLGSPQDIYELLHPETLKQGQQSGQMLPKQPRTVDEAKLSLVPFLAARGGLKETPDLRHIFDDNPFVPGFGRLFRKDGMSLDAAREAAVEAGYLTQEGRGGTERAGGGVTTGRDLLDALSGEARGRKVFREGHEPVEAAAEGNEAPEAAQETPGELWARFQALRQERQKRLSIAKGFNDYRTRSGAAALRGGVSQAWEPGNTVDVGFVKDLLITEHNPDGTYTLVSKPNAEGVSQSYNAKPHEGLIKQAKVKFQEATQKLVDEMTPPEELPEGLEPHEIAARQEEPLSPLMTDEDVAAATFFQREHAPIFYSAVARTIDNAKQAKASPDQWLATIKNTPGVKPEELEWLGLPDWLKEQKGSVTKEQIADYVRANQIEVKEVEKGEGWGPAQRALLEFQDRTIEQYGGLTEFWNKAPPSEHTEWERLTTAANAETQPGKPKFGSYTLPGAEPGSYRELLLTLPPKRTELAPESIAELARTIYETFERRGGDPPWERIAPDVQQIYRERAQEKSFLAENPNLYRSSHFDEPNILAHVRFNDRTIDGKKTLFVEEVQSDWHQKGKREGYSTGAPDTSQWKAEKTGRAWTVTDANGRRMGTISRASAGTDDEAVRIAAADYRGAVPDAPFKTTWPELSMKRMIRYAAEHGYDQIAWTSGETQAARYDLSKQIERVNVAKESDGTFTLDAITNDGRPVALGETIKPEGLADIVGKELADKITAQDEAFKAYSGLDLKVGGEGMKGFYDQILPATVNKLVKKFDAKVGKGELKTPDHTGDTPFTVWDDEGHVVERDVYDENRARQMASDWGGRYSVEEDLLPTKTEPIHTLPISDKLHEVATEQGFALFQGAQGTKTRIIRGKWRGTSEDFRDVITLMRDANPSTIIHEWGGHHFLDETLKLAEHEHAPEDFKRDARTILDWLGVKSSADLDVRNLKGRELNRAARAHEKFARGFETYVMEGRAPSHALARVFERFRQWLLDIYRTVRAIGSPINDEIRGVFDRMLATPQEIAERGHAVIAPERELPPGFDDEHERIAEVTPPQQAHGVANTIMDERDSLARANMVEEENARLTDIDRAVEERAPGSAEPPGHPNEAGTPPGEAGAVAPAGEIGAGGGEAAAQGTGLPGEPGKAPSLTATEPPVSPHQPFGASDTPRVDKIGNFRVDGINLPEDIDTALREAAERRGMFMAERRGVITDGEALRLAKAAGLDPAWLDRKAIGSAYSKEEIFLLEKLFVDAATKVRDAAAAVRAAPGDSAAALAQAEAMARLEMIQGKLAGATAEAGRSLAAVRRVVKTAFETRGALNDFLKVNTGRTLFQMEEMARLSQGFTKPEQWSRFVNDTKDGKLKQAVIFYYVNALISGPITHARYAAGNLLTALWSPLVKTPIGAGISGLRRLAGDEAAERIYLGEAGQELYGIIKGFREGVEAAKEGWRTGNTPDLPGEGGPRLFESQPTMPPIPGAFGYVIGLPGKGVGAVHGFSAMMRFRMEINRLAYRQAASEGLTGAAFKERVGDLSNRPTEAMNEAAAAVARKDLYMAPTEYDSLAGKLTRAANHNVLTKIMVPFMKIGTQITRNSLIEQTPLGLFDKKVRDNVTGKNGAIAQNQQIASIVGGMGLMGVMAMMTAEGVANGDGPADPEKRRVWLLTHHPNSIQIGDITVTYQGLGALGNLMRLAANSYEAYSYGSDDDIRYGVAASFLYGLEKSVLDEGFMRNLKDMIDAVYHREQYGEQYLQKMIANWIPFSIGLGQITHQIDPYRRETRSGQEAWYLELVDGLSKELQNKIPGLSEGLFPQRDMFGEPIPSSGPVQNYANDRTVKAMEDLHMKVGHLPRKIRGVALTDQQYDKFAMIAGRDAKMHLDLLVNQRGFERMTPETRMDQMHKIITAARERARTIVMQEAVGTDNDVMHQASEAKKIKKFGKPEGATIH